MKQAFSFFERRQKLLFIGGALYVLFLILSHSTLPSVHVWIIAAFFSIIMNLVYIVEAYSRNESFGIERFIAISLIAASFLGVFVSPIFVIAAIFAHGIWDILKHYGVGVPFFSWYTLGCFAIDMIYSLVLLIYWMAIG